MKANQEFCEGNMDYYGQTSENQFASSILALGILSVMTVFTGIMPPLFGSIGIILSVVGHKKGVHRTPSELLGLILSCAGLAIGIIMIFTAITAVLIPYYNDPAVFEQINEMYKGFGFDLKGILDSALPKPVS